MPYVAVSYVELSTLIATPSAPYFNIVNIMLNFAFNIISLRNFHIEQKKTTSYEIALLLVIKLKQPIVKNNYIFIVQIL